MRFTDEFVYTVLNDKHEKIDTDGRRVCMYEVVWKGVYVMPG